MSFIDLKHGIIVYQLKLTGEHGASGARVEIFDTAERKNYVDRQIPLSIA
jgi:hypothetical protein